MREVKPLIVFIRTIILYAALVLCIRLMGKRQVGEMEPAEFVVTMLLANLAAGPMQDPALPLLSALIPIFTVLALELVLAVLSMKSETVSRLLCGTPAILIRDGVIDQKALCANRMSMDELAEQLREKDVFDLTSVQYAILETDGELSVMLYPARKPATAEAQGIRPEPTSLPFTIVTDGKLMRRNLRLSGRSMGWLRRELKKRSLALRDLFLLTVDAAGKVIAVKKEAP